MGRVTFEETMRSISLDDWIGERSIIVFSRNTDYVYDDEWDNPNPVCPICENLSCACPKEIIAELGSMFGV